MNESCFSRFLVLSSKEGSLMAKKKVIQLRLAWVPGETIQTLTQYAESIL